MSQPNGPDEREASGTQVKTVGSGRYELGRQLGRGGMAEVCMAHDVRLGRTVAVKTLRADLAQDPVARSRFGREAQNAASLNHPAIVSVYDTGEDRVGDELVPFIVMECVEGRTVRELLAEGNPIPLEQALRITEGILEALEYSHRHGIIHRDIKPANVIITNSGAVKVMDFGIARAMHSAATTMTQTGMVMGTPQYLSPEQALGRTVDARSDLYSSGCLLYELLALRPPFNGDTPLSVVYQHVQDDARPPSAMDPRVPPHLDAIALKALAKNPDDRYQTADEMRMDIRRALAGQQVSVAVPPRVPAQAQPSYQTWGQAAAQGTGSAEQTAAMPALGNRPPHGGANDGGTGAMPELSEPANSRRRMMMYAIAGLAVVVVIVGALLVAKGFGDDGAKPGNTSPPVKQGQEKGSASSDPVDNGQVEQPETTTTVKPSDDTPSSNNQYQSNGGNWSGGNRMTPSPTATTGVNQGSGSGGHQSPDPSSGTTVPPVDPKPSGGQTKPADDSGGSGSKGGSSGGNSPPPGGGTSEGNSASGSDGDSATGGTKGGDGKS